MVKGEYELQGLPSSTFHKHNLLNSIPRNAVIPPTRLGFVVAVAPNIGGGTDWLVK